jgi:hypothetical protein
VSAWGSRRDNGIGSTAWRKRPEARSEQRYTHDSDLTNVWQVGSGRDRGHYQVGPGSARDYVGEGLMDGPACGVERGSEDDGWAWPKIGIGI